MMGLIVWPGCERVCLGGTFKGTGLGVWLEPGACDGVLADGDTVWSEFTGWLQGVLRR